MVSAEGVWAFKLSTTIIPKPSAQINDSDRNGFIYTVYHRPKWLVQPNETRLSSLQMDSGLVTSNISRTSLGSRSLRRAAFIVGSSGLRRMITQLSLRMRCIIDNMRVTKSFLQVAVVAGFTAWSMPLFAEETSAQSSVQGISEALRLADAAAALSDHGNDAPARQQAASLDATAATQAWLDSCPKGEARKIRRLFRGRLLAASLELSSCCSDFDLAVVVQNLSSATRFFGTTNEIENAASRLLQRSVFAARLRLKFSAQPVRALLSRASIRTGDTDFPAVV